MANSGTRQEPEPRGMDTHSTIESRPGAAITVRRIEVPAPIKAAISARILAARLGTKITR